ncbi:hypothetical protein [Qipengyuania sp.]|uniref:hypothetical protein n=1 Tax=Qipengyuania sp. TaxID=2004515 RepID=UPI0035C7AD41
MTHPLIENIARTLWQNSQLKPYHLTDAAPAMSVPEPLPDWERFIPIARSVLVGMTVFLEESEDSESDATGAMLSMIDVALKVS